MVEFLWPTPQANRGNQATACQLQRYLLVSRPCKSYIRTTTKKKKKKRLKEKKKKNRLQGRHGAIVGGPNKGMSAWQSDSERKASPRPRGSFKVAYASLRACHIKSSSSPLHSLPSPSLIHSPHKCVHPLVSSDPANPSLPVASPTIMPAKKRCQFQINTDSQCSSAALRIVGQCPLCRAQFCSSVSPLILYPLRVSDS